jgi:hypothetical protein
MLTPTCAIALGITQWHRGAALLVPSLHVAWPLQRIKYMQSLGPWSASNSKWDSRDSSRASGALERQSP